MNDPKDDSLLDFPCDYPLKVMGRAVSDFEDRVRRILSLYVEGEDLESASSRLSRNENYISMTFRFTAKSREQLNQLYEALGDDDAVTLVF